MTFLCECTSPLAPGHGVETQKQNQIYRAKTQVPGQIQNNLAQQYKSYIFPTLIACPFSCNISCPIADRYPEEQERKRVERRIGKKYRKLLDLQEPVTNK